MTEMKIHYEGDEYDLYKKYVDELNELFGDMAVNDVLNILCNYLGEALQTISPKEELAKNIKMACDCIISCAMDENIGRVQ